MDFTITDQQVAEWCEHARKCSGTWPEPQFLYRRSAISLELRSTLILPIMGEDAPTLIGSFRSGKRIA